MFRLFRWLVFFVIMVISLVNIHEAVQFLSGMFLDSRYVYTLLRDRTFPRTPEERDRNIEERPFFLLDESKAAALILSPLKRHKLLEERTEFRRQQAEGDPREYEDVLRPLLRWACLELNMC